MRQKNNLGENNHTSSIFGGKALRKSIFYSLDVYDFRDYLGITPEVMGDDDVIRQLHEARAESKCILIEARKRANCGFRA
jgi:hypothetical protein